MRNIALDIKPKDWFYILIIGVVFGMFLSVFGYMLQGAPWVDGAFFGILLGFCITLFSLVFITYMNTKILPNIKNIYWAPLSAFFSFAAGFLGGLGGTSLARFFSLELLGLFGEHLWVSVSFIGLLTYIVGVLLYRFVVIRNEKELSENAYLQSRLRSLETQLNPHFLFNALNSLAELVHQDPDKAEHAILRLSAFLRNTMDEKALIPLERELQNVQDYVALENIRFSGKINFVFPKKIPLWHVPKFSIQLLVENALKHGWSGEKKELFIEVTLDEEAKAIDVKNDGEALHSVSFGIGLSNLKQRLELLCGGKLEITATQMPTFRITLGGCRENIGSR